MAEITFLKLCGNCGPRKTCVAMPDAVHEIVKQSADSLGMDVSAFLASAMRHVVRERDLAIRRIRSEIRIRGRQPSTTRIGSWVGRDHSTVVTSLARSTSGATVTPLIAKPRRPSIGAITAAVCERAGLEERHVRSPDVRQRHVTRARQEVWAIAWRTHGHRLADLAAYFGVYDKKTVWDGIRAYEARQDRLALSA